MAKYLRKRIFYFFVVMLCTSFLMFLLYQLVPGDPVQMMLEEQKGSLTPENYARMYDAMRKQLGLDEPFLIQYIHWLFRMLRGDFGYSMAHHMKVIELVTIPLRNTIFLNFCAFLLVFSIALPIGVLCAIKKYSTFDYMIQTTSMILYSLPTFIIALLIIYLLGIKYAVFPISGMQTPGIFMSKRERILDLFSHMAMPLLVMTLSSVGEIIRYIRTAMIEVLNQDYIKTARAKGVSEQKVIFIHALRNAMIPVITIITSWFIGIFGGSVVIESIFGWNGIGKVLYEALRQQDYAVVLTMQMFYVGISLIGNLILDISYCFCDPRIRYE